MKISVIFGSQSDLPVYSTLVSKLELHNQVELEIISAHRAPVALEKALKKKEFDMVVAGAGLAAHLPGVTASKTLKPVIGIPVKAQFQGIDALLSTLQMPFGVPVLTFMPDCMDDLARYIENLKLLENYDMQNGISLVSPDKETDFSPLQQKEWDRTKKLASELSIPLQLENAPTPTKPNIVWVSRKEDIIPGNYPKNPSCIHVPIMDEQQIKSIESIFKLHDWSSTGGGYVGTNNSRNALLMWLIIFNKNGTQNETIHSIKKGY